MRRLFLIITLALSTFFLVSLSTFADTPPALGGEAYAFRQTSTQEVIVAIPLDDPAAETLTTGYTLNPGADFVNDDFTHWYVLRANNVLVYQNQHSGQPVVIGGPIPQGFEVWSGMTWDRTTSTMYAVATTLCTEDPTASLYTIDITTGEATRIGAVTNGGCLVDVAAHPTTGELYAIDTLGDVLLSIDKTTGAGTVIGDSGIDADLDRQGMDFNDGDGTLYYTSYSNEIGELRTVDLTTGVTATVGAFGTNTYHDGFAVAVAGGATAIQMGEWRAGSGENHNGWFGLGLVGLTATGVILIRRRYRK